MRRRQAAHADLERATGERFRLGTTTELAKHAGQVRHRHRHVDVLGAQRRLEVGDRATVRRLRLGQFLTALERQAEVGERPTDLGIPRRQEALPDREHFVQPCLRARRLAEYAVHLGARLEHARVGEPMLVLRLVQALRRLEVAAGLRIPAAPVGGDSSLLETSRGLQPRLPRLRAALERTAYGQQGDQRGAGARQTRTHPARERISCPHAVKARLPEIHRPSRRWSRYCRSASYPSAAGSAEPPAAPGAPARGSARIAKNST
jgi:hypothetical protein